jgi:PKD repeat protein
LRVETLTGSQALKKGAGADLKVTIANVPNPGVASLQGELGYDKNIVSVIQIKLPTFPESGSIVATNLSLAGRARFAATIMAKGTPPAKDGDLIIFRVTCLKNGTSPMTLTIEALADYDDDKVAFTVQNGAVQCRGGGQGPRVGFVLNPESPIQGQPVQFTDQSSDPDEGNIAQWDWNFGDGTKASERNPKHTYLNRGCYLVTLRVTDDDDSLSDQMSKRVSVSGGCPDILLINFPNPAKSETTFDYEFLKTVKQATLFVFDIKGRRVLENSKLTVTGAKNQLKWPLKDNSGKDLPNGPYFYWITAATQDNRIVKSPTNVLVIQR